MAILTEKLGLVKPEIDDMITPTIFAENFEKIETELYKTADCMTFDNENSMLQLRSGGETGTILSELEIRTGDVSVLLPYNPVVNVVVGLGRMILTWAKPYSEVEIKKYNIYISETQPSSLSDMTFKDSTTELTYTLEELEGQKTYYIAVQAVGVNEYENASISNIKNEISKFKFRFLCIARDSSNAGDEKANIARSVNGFSWERIDSNLILEKHYRDVTYGNGKFVCVGNNGKSYYSTNGITWTAMSGLKNTIYNAVTYGKDRFVCVGLFGGSAYSTDGLTWTAMSGLESATYNGVTYGNGKFVCVGDKGKSYYSTDGLTWNAMSGLESTTYYGVTYGNGKFVCVGNNGKSYYSTNGTSWNAMSGLESATYNAVTYGNGKFVCVGSNGKSYYSTDGASWIKMSGLESATYNAVTYDNCKFVCVGDKGKSYYSTDGLTWTAMSGLNSNERYNGVVCEN